MTHSTHFIDDDDNDDDGDDNDYDDEEGKDDDDDIIVSLFTDIVAVCTPESCKNNGLCVPSGLSYYCDCNMTSFVGTSCTERKDQSDVRY